MSSLGEEGSSPALTLAAGSGRARSLGPEPTEFAVRGSNRTPSGGRQPPSGFRPLATPLSPGCGEKGPACGSGKGRRPLHQTNLKSRSRPWVWLVKRMKASMAPSSRPSVALGSVVSPQGAAPTSRGRVSLETPEGLGLPVPWGRRIFPRATRRLPVWAGSCGY